VGGVRTEDHMAQQEQTEETDKEQKEVLVQLQEQQT
jgi:hypothetical protein